MKSDKLLKLVCFLLTILLAQIFLISCGGNFKDNTTASESKLQERLVNMGLGVVPTVGYLPQNTFDKAGNKLPYARMINPYTTVNSQLSAQSIESYIEARRAFKNKQYDKAKELLNSLTKLDKTLSGPWVLKGDIARAEKLFDDAINHYTKALIVNSNNSNAYLRLALVYREKGKFIHAQNAYANALMVWRDFPEAHLNLGILYDLFMNEPKKAQQHIEAYQFLSGNNSREIAAWLDEIRSRTGVGYSLDVDKPVASISNNAGG